MKKYTRINNNESIYFVGETNEIKSTYKSICRASEKYATSIFPLFSAARFSEFKSCYALEITCSDEMIVISSDVMLSLIINNEVVEIN